MPFSKSWRNAMYADYRAEGAYLDYKVAKGILHRMKENIANPSTPDELYDYLLTQEKIIYQWSQNKVSEIHDIAEKLLHLTQLSSISIPKNIQSEVNVSFFSSLSKYGSVHFLKKILDNFTKGNSNISELEAELKGSTKFSSSQPSPSSDKNEVNVSHPLTNEIKGSESFNFITWSDVKLAADSILHELLRYCECRNLNQDCVNHIINRTFRYSTLGPSKRWGELEKLVNTFDISIDPIFYCLSKIYCKIKDIIENDVGNSEKHTILSGAVGSQVFDRRSIKYWVHMQDLPFVIARILFHLEISSFKDNYSLCQTTGKKYNLGSFVSSVYYDNPNFLFYHRRLERLEESSLIRVRWYSDSLSNDWSYIAPDENVFVEMKVHHEAWSGERSTKRRFAIKERDVDAYFRGQLSLVPAIKALRKKKTSEEEITKFKQLGLAILQKVHAYNLHPVLRTQCNRLAFQRGLDQSVRISIDTNLQMSSEDFGLSHHWRYIGNDQTVIHFPYAVVEVKLQCAENEKIATWIEELMSCRYMESVPKFSKYTHGVSSIYGHTPRIKMIPYWVNQMGTDIRAATKPDDWDPTVGLISGCFPRCVDRLVFGMKAAQTTTVGASTVKFLERSGSEYTSIYYYLIGKNQPEVTINLLPAKKNFVSDDPRKHNLFTKILKTCESIVQPSLIYSSYGSLEELPDSNTPTNLPNTLKDIAPSGELPSEAHDNMYNSGVKFEQLNNNFAVDSSLPLSGNDETFLLTSPDGLWRDTLDIVVTKPSNRNDLSVDKQISLRSKSSSEINPLPLTSVCLAADSTNYHMSESNSQPHSEIIHNDHNALSNSISSSLVTENPLQSRDLSNSRSNVIHMGQALNPAFLFHIDRRHIAYTVFHMYYYTSSNAESLCFTISESKTKNNRNSLSEIIPSQIGKRIRVPQKYDPKTFFAVERYMLKWIERSFTVGSIGLLLLRYSNSSAIPRFDTQSQVSSVFLFLLSPNFYFGCGILLVILGLLIMGYAFIVFKVRSLRVYARRKIRFDDVMGPTILTFLLIFVILVSALRYILLRYGPMLTKNDRI